MATQLKPVHPPAKRQVKEVALGAGLDETEVVPPSKGVTKTCGAAKKGYVIPNATS